jgi:hypothetical protein
MGSLENLAATRVWSPDHPACRESLCWLHYYWHIIHHNRMFNSVSKHSSWFKTLQLESWYWVTRDTGLDAAQPFGWVALHSSHRSVSVSLLCKWWGAQTAPPYQDHGECLKTWKMQKYKQGGLLRRGSGSQLRKQGPTKGHLHHSRDRFIILKYWLRLRHLVSYDL